MVLALADIFSNGMVLQREKPAHVWGTAEPQAEVRVSVQGQDVATKADAEGAWACTLEPLAASEREVLVVESGGDRIEVGDVAVGEVFIAGGQSNMEFWMRYERHLAEALEGCENPRVRFVDMPKVSYPGQLDDFDYSRTRVWLKAAPDTLERFSAVGYYFARELEAALDVPVGIVGCNYGGTKSLAWMAPEHARETQPSQVAAFEAKLQGLPYETLLANGRLNPSNDKGYATWPAWNEFFLPRTPTEDEIRAFMEGEAAKESGPADVGGLTIAVGAKEGGAGDVAGDVAQHPGIKAPTKEAPGALFTYMTLPLAPYAARGVLWYQGESDDEDAGAQAAHKAALKAIVADWRAAFADDELPFFVVQIPGFGSWLGFGAQDYPTIRRCQQEVADEDDRVWLCSIGDAGDEWDIHPKDKTACGHRLALLAERHLFGMDLLADAPVLTGVTREGATITLRFGNAGEGLRVVGDALAWLDVLADGAEAAYAAEARGDELRVVLDDADATDVELRFAQTGWYCINLVNSAGIPALPFVARC